MVDVWVDMVRQCVCRDGCVFNGSNEHGKMVVSLIRRESV